jgi:membrane-associated phospholipid phosphatase
VRVGAVSGLRHARVSAGALTTLPLWAEVLAAAVVLGPAMTLIYRLAAARAVNRAIAPPWWLDTPLDRLVPTVPAAVWIYVSWYPAIALLALGGRVALRYGYVAFALAFLVCSLGHVLLPVQIVRPEIDAGGGVSATLLAWFYTFDPPYNLFPSFHAAGAGVVARARFRSTGWRAVARAWALALCASCVLIKQHYVIDVVVGLAVGLSAAALARQLQPD